MMTNEQFIQAVFTIYEQARLVQLPGGIQASEKIRRGRNHTVSALLEDLFAHFLVQRFECIDKIVLDQCIRFKDKQGNPYELYPDLMIICDGEIRAIVDMKTDLGRKRDTLENVLEKVSHEVDILRGQQLRYKDGITKEIFTASVSPRLRSFMVALSRENINAVKLQEQLDNITRNPNIVHAKIYFLTSDVHPNRAIYHGSQQRVRMLQEFDELVRDIGKLLI